MAEESLCLLRRTVKDSGSQGFLPAASFQLLHFNLHMLGSQNWPMPPEILTRNNPIAAVKACKMDHCFEDKSIFGRTDFCDLLETSFPAVPGGKVVTYEFPSGMKFWRMAQFILPKKTSNLRILSKLLIERGMTFSPKQVEAIVMRFENGDVSFELFSSGFSNFFFVHDKRYHIFLLSVRIWDGWTIQENEFENYSGDGAPQRLLTRN